MVAKTITTLVVVAVDRRGAALAPRGARAYEVKKSLYKQHRSER